MSEDVNIILCRNMLTEAHRLVRLTGLDINLKRDAWTYNLGRGQWEFHHKGFYWHGRAHNGYDARYKGWMSWLRTFYPEIADEEV